MHLTENVFDSTEIAGHRLLETAERNCTAWH